MIVKVIETKGLIYSIGSIAICRPHSVVHIFALCLLLLFLAIPLILSVMLNLTPIRRTKYLV
jgi:hypothetical protein